MADENVIVTDPLAVSKKLNEQLADRDARIKTLEAELKSLGEKHSAQKKRADRLEAQAKAVADEPTEPLLPEKGVVVFVDRVRFASLGEFRADNTFAEVKRGYCPEGVMLVAIDRPG